MSEILSYSFMQNALLAGILVSIACGIIGTLVVLKKMVFISGGVAHTAYGGVGLAFYLGSNPVLGAVAFSMIASFLMGTMQRQTRQRQDTLIGVMWAMGMAVGILFADMTPGYKADLMSYLFGSILAVTSTDLLLMLVHRLRGLFLRGRPRRRGGGSGSSSSGTEMFLGELFGAFRCAWPPGGARAALLRREACSLALSLVCSFSRCSSASCAPAKIDSKAR